MATHGEKRWPPAGRFDGRLWGGFHGHRHAIGQEPGFVAYFALDTGEATVETVSIFHDKAAADASNELASDYVRENLGEFELTRTAVSGGEVLVSRVTAGALDDAHRWRSDRARRHARESENA